MVHFIVKKPFPALSVLNKKLLNNTKLSFRRALWGTESAGFGDGSS